uniref:Uncharacterized protein n=1 Tax=Arcella intermedia TaxID=1963864 RepID=A0A6B2LJ77_9EUKA
MFQQSIKMLLSSYEEFISQTIPPPQFLPINITIEISSKKLLLNNVILNKMDNLSDIKKIILQKMEQRGEEIIDLEENQFVLFDKALEKEIPIEPEVPIIQYHPSPGSLIIIKGSLKCQSEAPKECFKNKYIEGANMKMTYYTCKDCKFNWICKSCAEVCHASHNITCYINNHSPSWPCCYCPKKEKCSLCPKK